MKVSGVLATLNTRTMNLFANDTFLKVCLKFASMMIQLVVDDSQKTTETESKEQTVYPDSTNITSDPNATENESTETESTEHNEGTDSTNNGSSSDLSATQGDSTNERNSKIHTLTPMGQLQQRPSRFKQSPRCRLIVPTLPTTKQI